MAVQKKYDASRAAREWKERAEARETIKRFDPALAMYLDVHFPIEKCPHWGREIRQIGGNRMHWTPRYKCLGCGIDVTRYANRYISTIERRESINRLREALERTNDYDD